MKKIFIAKILALSAALLLLFNLVFSSYLTIFDVTKFVKKEQKEISIQTGDDYDVVVIENEEPEEDSEDDKFVSLNYDFVNFDYFFSERQNFNLKEYNLNEAPHTSVPRWLLVRHILI